MNEYIATTAHLRQQVYLKWRKSIQKITTCRQKEMLYVW